MDMKETIEQLTERIQRTANVRAIFGEPIREGDRMIVPVGRISVRGGGGGGRNKPRSDDEGEENSTGIGLGLNIAANPIGYIEAKDGEQPQFVPVVDRTRVALASLAVGALALWVMKATLRRWLG